MCTLEEHTIFGNINVILIPLEGRLDRGSLKVPDEYFPKYTSLETASLVIYPIMFILLNSYCVQT